MELNLKIQNTFTMVTIEVPRLDSVNMQEMKTALNALVDAGQSRILVNLSQVDFIDSSGLSVLISLFKHLNASNGTLKLCSLKEQPLELLNITKLYRLFSIVENCEDASS